MGDILAPRDRSDGGIAAVGQTDNDGVAVLSKAWRALNQPASLDTLRIAARSYDLVQGAVVSISPHKDLGEWRLFADDGLIELGSVVQWYTWHKTGDMTRPPKAGFGMSATVARLTPKGRALLGVP